MKELLIYISQISLLIAFVYFVYKFILARVAFHNIKRFVLLFLIIISFILPICKVTIQKEIIIENAECETVLNDIIPLNIAEEIHLYEIERLHSLEVWWIIGIIYLIGIVTIFMYRMLGIWKVKSLMKNSINKHIFNGIEVLLLSDNISAFSFGNKIIMSQSDYNTNADMVIKHELIHIRQHHSIDLFLINVILSLQWFNPFIWFIRRELILIHEFSADQGVIKSGIDVKKYQYLLISKSTCCNDLIPVVNHFRSGDLHKRIRTMKLKSSKWALLKLLVVFPFVSIALFAFAETKYDIKMEQEEVISEKEVFHMPFEGKIRAKYGKRPHPITKKEYVHKGIDVVVTNDTVWAPYSGIIVYADFPKDGYGNKLVIAHKDDLETTYAHLAKFLVKEGANVKGGEPIAIVGNTGLSTGKHLHLECRINDEIINPEVALPLNQP